MNEQMISSLQNDRVKRMVALGQKSSLRRSEGVIVVEGRRELEHCIHAGHKIVAVYHCPALLESIPACDCPCYEASSLRCVRIC